MTNNPTNIKVHCTVCGYEHWEEQNMKDPFGKGDYWDWFCDNCCEDSEHLVIEAPATNPTPTGEQT